MLTNMKNKKLNQKGQTLIETLVAAFILTMGISAALGLAQYSLHATSDIKQRIIAIGLAREGLEAVKNIRDTNWLQGTVESTCYNFQSGEFNGQHNANCYTNWLNPKTDYSYNISSSGTYALWFDTSDDYRFWQLVPTNDFGLNYSPGKTSKGLYFAEPNVTVSTSNSGFGRAITISTENGVFPFDQDTGGRLTVTSEVWWHDTKCPISDSIPTNPNCKIKLQTYLTNWKTF